MTHVFVRPHQVRPRHTGTARVESLRAQARAGRLSPTPTHLRLANAAVALAPAPVAPSKSRAMRWARRPLDLAQGRRALALRQDAAAPIEVLVQTPSGQKGWRVASKVLAPDQLRAWVREGFGSR